MDFWQLLAVPPLVRGITSSDRRRTHQLPCLKSLFTFPKIWLSTMPSAKSSMVERLAFWVRAEEKSSLSPGYRARCLGIDDVLCFEWCLSDPWSLSIPTVSTTSFLFSEAMASEVYTESGASRWLSAPIQGQMRRFVQDPAKEFDLGCTVVGVISTG